MAENQNRSPKRRRSRRKAFRRGLIIYAVLFLLIGFGALGGFSKYLASYELGRGALAVSEWMKDKTEDDYRALMLSEPILELTEFEQNEDILNAYFDASCSGKSFSYREATGVSTAEKPVFTLKAGSADVGRITLRQGSSVGFGFHRWEVDSVEPYISPYALRSVTIALEALPEEELYLNGVAIGKQYVVNEDVPFTDLSTLESRYAEQPHLVRYEISGLYGALTVTDSDGNEISATDENGTPLYRLGGEGGYSFTLICPAECSVTVCGVALTEAELVESGINPLEGLEAFLGESCNAAQLTYSASGLYRKPEIEVAAPEGMTITKTVAEDGTILYTAEADEALREEQLAVVQSFFEANMNYGAGNKSYLQTALEKTLYGTELYNYFSNSTAAMIWASNTTISYDYLNYENFVPHGDNCFTCTVSYKAKLTATSWYETTQSELQDSYLLAFVKHQGVWYAASMSLIE